MTRSLPSTSHEANRKATIEMRHGHYEKIKSALAVLGTCNYEKIADHVGLDRHAVGRRMKEMEGLEMVYKPGTQSPTKSGRMAMNYCLTGSGMPKIDNQVNEYKKGVKASSDFSKELIQSTQANLFP